MEKLQSEFKSKEVEKRADEQQPPEAPNNFKALIDSLKAKNNQKALALNGLEAELKEVSKENGALEKDKDYEKNMSEVPFELESDVKKVAVLKELLGLAENRKMNGKIKFILEELKKADDELFQEEWRNEEVSSKLKGLEEDINTRKKQMGELRELESLIGAKKEQIESARNQAEMRNEEVQRELGVLQCFVDSADAKQQNKLQSMKNLKDSCTDEVRKLANETVKNREKTSQRTERLRKIKEKAKKLEGNLSQKCKGEESTKDISIMLEVLSSLIDFIRKTQGKATGSIEKKEGIKTPRAKMNGSQHLNQREMGMKMSRFTSEKSLADLVNDLLKEYRNILEGIQNSKRRFQTLNENLDFQKNSLKKHLTVLGSLKGEESPKGINEPRTHQNNAHLLLTSDQNEVLAKATQTIKRTLEESRKTSTVSKGEVSSFWQLELFYKEKKGGFDSQIFKERIEAASSFVLSGIFLVLLLDDKLLHLLGYIGKNKEHKVDLQMAIDQLKRTAQAIKARMNTESIVRPMGSNENWVDDEPQRGAESPKRNGGRKTSRKIEPGELKQREKQESFEVFPQFPEFSEFFSEVVCQEQLIKFKKKNDLKRILGRVSNGKPGTKGTLESLELFQKAIEQLRNEVFSELLIDFDRVLFEYRSIVALISRVIIETRNDPERLRSIAKSKNLLAMKLKGQKTPKKEKGNDQKQETPKFKITRKTSQGSVPFLPFCEKSEKETGFPTEFDEMENSEYFEQMHSNERAKILEMQAKALEKDVVLPKTQYVSPSHHLYLQSFRPTYKLQHYVTSEFGKQVKEYSQTGFTRAETEPSQTAQGLEESVNRSGCRIQTVSSSGALSTRRSMRNERSPRKLQLEVLKGENKSIGSVVDKHLRMMVNFNVPRFSTGSKRKTEASQRGSSLLSISKGKKNKEMASPSTEISKTRNSGSGKSGMPFKFRSGGSLHLIKSASGTIRKEDQELIHQFQPFLFQKTHTGITSFSPSNHLSKLNFFFADFAPKPVLISNF